MPSNNVFQYSKIRTRKRSAKKSIKTGKKNGIQLFLESGIHCVGIRNPVPGIRNPWHGIQNPRLSWIPFHGVKSTRVKAVVVQLTADQTLEATGSFPVLKRCIWAAKARKQQRRQWQRPRAISVIRGTLNTHVHYTFLIIIIFLRGMSNLSELLGKGILSNSLELLQPPQQQLRIFV